MFLTTLNFKTSHEMLFTHSHIHVNKPFECELVTHTTKTRRGNEVRIYTINALPPTMVALIAQTYAPLHNSYNETIEADNTQLLRDRGNSNQRIQQS
jgi:hypothetical protein